MTKIIIQEYMLLFCRYTDCPLKSAATSPWDSQVRHEKPCRSQLSTGSGSVGVMILGMIRMLRALAIRWPQPPTRRPWRRWCTVRRHRRSAAAAAEWTRQLLQKTRRRSQKKTKTKKIGFDLMHNSDKNTLICFMQFRPELDGCIFVFCGLMQGYIVSTLIKPQYLLEKGSQEF